MNTIKWTFRNTVTGIAITDSKEEAVDILNSGEGYKCYYPSPLLKDGMQIYLLVAEEETMNS